MTLVLKLDLNMVKLFLCTKNEVPSYSSSNVVTRIDRPTCTQTDLSTYSHHLGVCRFVFVISALFTSPMFVWKPTVFINWQWLFSSFYLLYIAMNLLKQQMVNIAAILDYLLTHWHQFYVKRLLVKSNHVLLVRVVVAEGNRIAYRNFSHSYSFKYFLEAIFVQSKRFHF